jgi:hypothetical protein
MRKATLTSTLILCATVHFAAAELSEIDRQRLVAHMEMTSGWLMDELSNLSQDQLDFRRASGSWSIREVLDHLVVVGRIYWDDLKRAVDGPAADRRFSSSDADILWYGIDRTHRETAIPSERPTGQLRDLRRGLETYREHHARLLQYAKTTRDDLRRHWVDRQRCDAYQWALLISTHEQRHILQIREIKRTPGFPKK